jgi:drug/metabolite transporter superfamily protein YnfA
LASWKAWSARTAKTSSGLAAYSRVFAIFLRLSWLRVVDGVVLPAWGVAGVAEASAAQSREQVQQQLQAELDQLGVLLARRRSTLVATLAGSRELLATHAARLR